MNAPEIDHGVPGGLAQAHADAVAELRTALGPAAILPDEPLSRHTTLRVGGPADLCVVVETIDALQQAALISWRRHLPCRVLGNRANVLVSDAGVRGVVILNRARGTAIASATVHAESGALLAKVSRKCAAAGLAGLEWATSIPGTVGGAIVGNAGAWGGDIASTLLEATVLCADGVVERWRVGQFDYGYRTSTLKNQMGAAAPRAIVLDARFALTKGNRDALEAIVAGIAAQRKARQPPGATCGSVFRNPLNDHAGRLIEAAGLKGQHRGDAEISAQHANFIVNHGSASARDIKALINLARETVLELTGVGLELEIELVGEW